MGEACAGADEALIDQLAGACDAPRNDAGVKRGALPQFFNTWSRCAWVGLLRTLPEEEEAAELSAPAQEQFRARVAAALHTIVSLGQSYRHGDGELTDVQRCSVID
jgi:hypothetical protein